MSGLRIRLPPKSATPCPTCGLREPLRLCLGCGLRKCVVCCQACERAAAGEGQRVPHRDDFPILKRSP